ncbi:MAG: hypothetical protein J0H12_04935 [Candidatus Paracaedimonas acanthamoebae]|uniref:TonB C-terminal domain-containing protein n=1 Tax=Candidatus Paracaedimonas acanthamoebae TaxID=244581 RepID=A0A8J7Q0T3_9PROT|nr:hypothetical protein [Candidatus Paracaedimonas acanthamoebae]
MSFGPVIKIAFLFTLSSVSSFSSPMALEGYDYSPKKRSAFGRQTSILSYVQKSGEVLPLSSTAEWGVRSSKGSGSVSPKRKRQIERQRKRSPQKTIDSCWNIYGEITSQKPIEAVLIDGDDKENISPAFSSINKEEKKEQKAQFMGIFRQPLPEKYERIKKDLLKKTWLISQHGNPYLQISSSEASDSKEHYIVIIQRSNKDTGKTEYSAYIDGRPYEDFIKEKRQKEQEKLSPVWFPDHDSIKRASLTIIYK